MGRRGEMCGGEVRFGGEVAGIGGGAVVCTRPGIGAQPPATHGASSIERPRPIAGSSAMAMLFMPSGSNQLVVRTMTSAMASG